MLFSLFQRSLHARLVGGFLGLSFITLVLVAATAYTRLRNAITEAVATQLTTVAEDKAAEVVRWVQDQRHDLEFIATTLAPGTGPLAEQLDAAALHAVDVEELFVLSGVGGRVMASTHRPHVGDYRTNDLFFVHGRDSTFIQSVYPSPRTARPTLTIATPIRDRSRATTAVLAAHLNFGHIDATIGQRTGLGVTGEAYLVSQLNDFVNAERFGDPRWRRGVHTVGVQRAFAREVGTARYVNYAGVPVIGAWQWIAPLELALLVEITQREAYAPARRGLQAVLVVGGLSVLLLATAMMAMARRIVGPVSAVADAATRVAGGDFHARAPVTTADEVGRLARAFNDMVQQTRDALAALEESRALLNALVVNSSNGVAVVDAQGRFQLVNERFTWLMNVEAAGLIGRAPATALPAPAATVLHDLARRALDGRQQQRELTLGAFDLQVVAFPLTDPARHPFGAGLIVLDLTERNRAEEERRHLETRVQHAQRIESLGMLAGGIAHDFNNLLGAILAHATLVRDQLPADSPAREDLDQAITTTERAADLTHQLLAYAGKASLAVTTFDLNDAIRELGALLSVSLPQEVRVVMELSHTPLAVRADAGQIQQVVLNLMTNAAEACRADGGTVTVRTGPAPNLDDWVVAPTYARPCVMLAVWDDGPGMPEETRTRIFDPFFSTKGTGRGLGLAAVLGIVRGSGGGLHVASAPGRGTTMTVVLPAAEVPAPRTARSSGPTETDLTGTTILLAEDERAVRRAATRILQRAGATVIEAVNGREAVEQFRAQCDGIGLVILDVTMPEMSGHEAYEAIRALAPRVPVVFSSGYDEHDVGRMAEDAHVSFLAKPYRAETLTAKVRVAIRS